MKFRFFEHTADIGIEAYGKNINELFENSALATLEVMVDTKQVKPAIKKEVKLENKDLGNLLFDFLDEIVYYKDSERLLFSKFDVNINKNKVYRLNAKLYGEKIDAKKHELRDDVKAVTLYEFKLEKSKEGYKARFILDI
ncbi:MAG: archease [Nanoarchaeota archaeon]